MATPEKVSVKFVESLPQSSGGFGGGHAKDLSPIIEALKKRPDTWALIAEGEKSLGALQRLPEFDVEVKTVQDQAREYTGKDGKAKKGHTIKVYARFVKGYTAARATEAAKRKAAKGAPAPAAKK